MTLLIIICVRPVTFALVNSPQQEKEKQKDECDFSGYNPIRISDYRIPIRKRVEPEYPKLAVDAGIAGRVTVKVLVDLKGNVVRACAATGHPVLKQPSVESALKWKFIRNCKRCFGRKARYMVEWIVFRFEPNVR
jgi:outer membrane biosynthesis protein TonB